MVQFWKYKTYSMKKVKPKFLCSHNLRAKLAVLTSSKTNLSPRELIIKSWWTTQTPTKWSTQARFKKTNQKSKKLKLKKWSLRKGYWVSSATSVANSMGQLVLAFISPSVSRNGLNRKNGNRYERGGLCHRNLRTSTLKSVGWKMVAIQLTNLMKTATKILKSNRWYRADAEKNFYLIVWKSIRRAAKWLTWPLNIIHAQAQRLLKMKAAWKVLVVTKNNCLQVLKDPKH